jgi:LAS superfamily LD-carboxypeptidase LdcB
LSNYPKPYIAALAIAAILLGIGGYRYYVLDIDLKRANLELDSTRASLLALTHEKSELESALLAEQEKNNQFEAEISGIASTVGVLQKLNQTDAELLQKYSKVFFLNEHYIPSKLIKLDRQYLTNKTGEQYLHAQVWPYLSRMLEAAAENETPLEIISAYRSFHTQGDLKSSYTVTYGSGANKFSADQGYSEHQLGTTVDLTTQALGNNYTELASTKAYQWLNESAHRYGFVLSYPKDNAYYIYEPWHWRFVGIELATKLHEDGKHFYDLDQREINSHLVNIFD